MIKGREGPNMGLPAATIATSVNKKGKESWLLKNSLPRSMPKGKKKVMEKERGGHLYKNSTTPAASMEVRKKERVIERERGGHLYKNSAMPAASGSREVRKEEVGEPRAGPTTVALATSPGGSRLPVPPWVRPPILASAKILNAGTRLGAPALPCSHILSKNFGKLNYGEYVFYASPPSFPPFEIYSLGRSEMNAGLVLRLRGGGSEEDSSPEKFSDIFHSLVEDPVDPPDFQPENVKYPRFLQSAKVFFSLSLFSKCPKYGSFI